MMTGRAKVVPENSGGGSDPAHINAQFLTAAAGDVTCRLRTAPLRVVPDRSRCAGVVLAASAGTGFTAAMLPAWLTASLTAHWPGPMPAGLARLQARVAADAAQIAARLRQDWQLYALLAPLALWFAVFLYKPMLGLRIAFKDYSLFLGLAGSPWIGLENFWSLLADDQFRRAIRNTLTISACSLLIAFPVPIALAVMFNEIIQGSQDVGGRRQSRRPDEQSGDPSASLQEIRRQSDLELEILAGCGKIISAQQNHDG